MRGNNRQADEATKEALANAVKILKEGHVTYIEIGGEWEELSALQDIWCGNGMQGVLEEIWQSARREYGSRNTHWKNLESWALSERNLGIGVCDETGVRN